jgi:hypothetical protein
MKPNSRPFLWTLTVARFLLVLGALLMAVRPGVAQPVIVNPSFEADAIPAWPGYGPITGWTSPTQAGINGSTGPFHDNGVIPHGEKVGFLQANASLSQVISGFTVGSTYVLQYSENARNCCSGTAQLRVTINGAEIVPLHNVPPVGGSSPYREVISQPFLATAASMELAFVKSAVSGDNTVLLDHVRIVEIPPNAPPTITTQPQNRSAAVGDTVSFSVSALGALPLTYQWKRNNENLTGETGPTLTLENLTAEQAGAYSVVVSNAGGDTTSNPATLTVLSPIPGFYNTGVDHDGNALADGEFDPHYLFISNPDSLTRQPIVHDSTVFPIVAGPWLANTASSTWIGPRFNTVGSLGSDYTYRLSVNLNGFDPATVVITGGWATDNAGLQIRVNGQNTGLSNSAQFGSLTTFTLDSSNATFVPGINTIDFVLNNSALGYTGLRVGNLRGLGVPAPDTAPPTIRSVGSRGNPNAITVTFSENVSASALNESNYAVNNGVTVSAADYGSSENIVVLTTSAMTPGVTYAVTVNNVADQAAPANTIAPDSSASFVFGSVIPGTFVTDFNSGVPIDSVVFGHAFVDSTGGPDGSGVLKLTLNQNDRNGRFLTGILNGGNPIESFIATFKVRVGGGANPQADGFAFVLANDMPLDNATRWTGGAEEEGAGTGLTVAFDNWDNGGGEAPAIDIKWGGVVVASTKMGTQQVSTIDTFDEFVDVMIRLNRDGTVDVTYRGDVIHDAVQTAYRPFPNARLALGARTGGANANHWIDDLSLTYGTEPGPVTFLVQPPAELTVDEGARVVLSVTVDGTPVFSYQWSSNGIPIEGATGSSYTIPWASVELDQTTFSVTVNNEFSSATSSTVLTVTPDTTPPTLLSVSGTPNLAAVLVVYSEQVLHTNATDTWNYTMSGDISIASADLLPDQRTVVLRLNPPLQPATTYNLAIEGVTDISSNTNVIAPTSVNFTTWSVTNGVVLREMFLGNVGPNTFQTISNNARFPDHPHHVTLLTELNSPQTPANVDNYSLRVRGWVIPTETGNYRFQVRADDSALLMVGTGPDPASIRTLIFAEGGCGACNSPTSGEVFLVRGVPYYLDALMQEGTGGDYLEVKWALPSDPGNFIIIPGASLAYGTPPGLDLTAPSIVSVEGSTSLRHITIRFDELIDRFSATDVHNYVISQGGVSLNLLSAVLTADGRGVVLTTSLQIEGAPFQVAVDGVEDFLAGNQASGSIVGHSYVITPGFVKFEYYTGFGGTTVADLTNNPKYPAYPDLVRYNHIPWWPQTVNPVNNSSDGTAINQNYGMRISGYFIPRVSGEHRFFLINDDQAMLRMSPNDDPADAADLFTSACCRNLPFEDPRSAVVPGMIAGQRYYFEALMKEGGGGDYLGVGVREPGDTRPHAKLNFLLNHSIAVGVDPANAAGEVTIDQQPANASAAVGQRATFRVVTSSTGNLAPFYQWRKDGVNIPGANSTTYTTPALTSADDGAVYTVIAYLPGTSAASDPAVLSIAPDTAPPFVVSAAGRGTAVHITFNEELDNTGGEATDPMGYEINGVPGVQSITVRPDNRSIILNLTAAIDADFTLRVNSGIKDLAGNTVAEHPPGSGWSAPIDGVLAMATADVGGTLPAGTVFNSNNTDFTVTAGGNDVWSGGDQFTYVYETRTGNFDVMVRVDRLDFVGNNWAKAGINIREDLDGSSQSASRMVWVYPTPTDGAGTFEGGIRAGPGENMIDFGQPRPGALYPAWLRVKRVGKSFTAFTSYDGRNWDIFGIPRVGDHVNSFPDTLLVGLGTLSHVQGTPTTAQFSEYGDWAYENASITITQQPVGGSNSAGQTRSFTVAGLVSGAPQWELDYQWQRKPGGTSEWLDILGANRASYATPPLTLDNNGDEYRAVLLVSGAEPAISAAVLVTVTPLAETVPPAIRTAYRSTTNPDQIIVNFSELLRASTAANPANYTLSHGGEVLAAQVTRSDRVILTTSGLSNCAEQTLTFNGVEDASGNAMAGTQVTLGQAGSRILLVMGNAYSMNASDAAIMNRLLSNGHEVDIASAVMINRRGAAAHLNGVNLVFILPSAGDGDIGNRFRDSNVGVVVSRRQLFDDFDFGPNQDGTGWGIVGGQTQVNIVNAAHPLAGGLAAGNRTILSTGRNLNFGGAFPASVIEIARNSAGDRVVYFAFERGAALLNSRNAQARRVGFFLEQNGENLNADGLRLVDAAVNWAMNPLILTSPQDQTVPAGGTAVFCVLAGNGAPATYQWLLNGEPIPGATGRRLVLNSVTTANEGNYSVVVGNGLGDTVTTSAAALVVSGGVPAPVITAQPEGATVAAGGTVNLSVTATGEGLTYRWTRNGEDVEGGASATLVLSNVGAQHSGSYRVEVANAGGSVLSEPATVRVLVPVSIMNVGVVGGQITAQIQTVAGLTYRIQMTAELKADGSTEWTTIGTVNGNGGVIPLAAPIGPGNAFFRVVVE